MNSSTKYTIKWTVQWCNPKSKKVKKSPEFDTLDEAVDWYDRNAKVGWHTIAIRSRKVATNDVPGARKSNRDELAMGCWAEHEDGSLMFVESTENGRCIYSVFDVSFDPPVEYRDAMKIRDFKKTYSWKPGKKDKWTWHDKTPFPWDKIIELGAKDGVRHSSADHLLTAAERVARSRKLKGAPIEKDDHKHKVDTKSEKAALRIMKGIQEAIESLRS